MCIVWADSSWSIAFVNCTEFSVLKLWQLKYSVASSRHMHYSIHPINTILNKKRKILYWKQSIEWKTHRKKIRKSTCTMIRIKTGFDSWTNKRQVEIIWESHQVDDYKINTIRLMITIQFRRQWSNIALDCLFLLNRICGASVVYFSRIDRTATP